MSHNWLFAFRGEGRSALIFMAITDTSRRRFCLADVYVLESHRGQGLSKWLLEVIQSHQDLQGLRRFMLSTRDAHGLYAQFGFTALANPSRMMEIVNADAYHAERPPP
jgi:GNAT superfamily N-acetyltransferase